MKCPWRSMWTGAGMEARATSSKLLASRTSMNGEMFGSGEMTEDKITPERRTEGGQIRTVLSRFRCRTHVAALTVVFLHGSRRRHEDRLRREAVLLPPLHVLSGDDVKLCDLSSGGRRGRGGGVTTEIYKCTTCAAFRGSRNKTASRCLNCYRRSPGGFLHRLV